MARISPSSAVARTSHPGTGIQADTRATIASATRSGSRLALTARINLREHVRTGQPTAHLGLKRPEAPSEVRTAC